MHPTLSTGRDECEGVTNRPIREGDLPGLAGMGQKTGVQRTQRARKRRESFKRLPAVLGRIEIPSQTMCSFGRGSELSAFRL